jgi:mannose-6-phosphate isomerase-like protein (cupin superfamily)
VRVLLEQAENARQLQAQHDARVAEKDFKIKALTRRPGGPIRMLSADDCALQSENLIHLAHGSIQMAIDPVSTYVHLGQDGTSAQLPGGDAFWSMPEKELDAIGEGWLVSEFVFTEDWPNWEMHPAGDEIVYLLDGQIRLLLDMPSGRQEIPIEGKGAAVIPKAVWHTAKVAKPSRVLHITMGKGTQSMQSR